MVKLFIGALFLLSESTYLTKERERVTSNVTAESCCVLLELDKDSHHPKTLYDASNTKYTVHHFQHPPCFQRLPGLWFIFTMAYIAVQLYS